MNYKILKQLEALAVELGGQIIRLPRTEFRTLGKNRHGDWTWSAAPFRTGLAVNWTDKHIYIDTLEISVINWTEVVHEMGHVFASKQSPDQSTEVEFLGWEYAVAKFLGASDRSWQRGNYNYVINFKEDEDKEAFEIGQLKPRPFKRMVQERLTVARELGLLGEKDRPLSIR